MPSELGNSDFGDYYERTYSSQHRNKLNRLCHLLGFVAGIAGIASGVAQKDYYLRPTAGVVGGYLLTIVGHVVFEGNLPRPFKNPVWSFLGNLRSCAELLIGK